MLMRYVTLWGGYAKAVLLYTLASIPWLTGLLIGLTVSLVLWLVVAALDGYRIGRMRP